MNFIQRIFYHFIKQKVKEIERQAFIAGFHKGWEWDKSKGTIVSVQSDCEQILKREGF